MMKLRKKLNKKSQAIMLIVIVAVLVIAGFLLMRSFAAQPAVSLEAENSTLTTNAKPITETSASAGKGVQFTAAPTGTNPMPLGLGQTNGPSGTWNLKLNENFDGINLDNSRWSRGWNDGRTNGSERTTEPVQSQETACYVPAQTTVSGGMLRMAAVEVPGGISCGGKTRKYASGAIDSWAQTSNQYSFGYFEARVWLDIQNNKVANWPAWWLNGYCGGGNCHPQDGELDVMEGLSGVAKGTWHGPNGNGNLGGYTSNPAQGAGWHTFAAEWSQNLIQLYYDGVKVGNGYTNSSNITSAKQYLIFGMQMSPENQYGGPIKAPTEMLVDYVRVWQK